MMHTPAAWLAALAAIVSASIAQAAEPYPVRPILLVVPFPPGGVVELVGRPLAHSLEKFLKQPVVVTNKPGAAGAVGNAFVASSEADGYKLLMSLSSISAIRRVNRAASAPSMTRWSYDRESGNNKRGTTS